MGRRNSSGGHLWRMPWVAQVSLFNLHNWSGQVFPFLAGLQLVWFCFQFVFESWYVVQVPFAVTVFLPQAPERWDGRRAPPFQ